MKPTTTAASATKLLRIGICNPVEGLDPRGMLDFANIIVLWQMYETLYSPSVGYRAASPLLLKEPLCPEGGKAEGHYSGILRDDVKFWDGTPLTADHVVDCLRRNKAFAAAAEVGTNGNSLVFKTKRADTRLDLMLTRIDLAIATESNGKLVGTGAYMPAADSTSARLHLTRNPGYRTPVPISDLEFVPYPRSREGRADALQQALIDHRVDFTMSLSPTEAEHLTGLRKTLEVGTSTAILFFNTEKYPLSETAVRRAIAYAIDRVELARVFYTEPFTHVATGLLPPFLGRVPDSILYNQRKAQALLTASGVDPGKRPLKLFVIWGPRPYLPNPLAAAEKIAAQLQPLGFTLQIEAARDTADYFRRAASGDYDFVLGGYVPDTAVASDYLDIMLASDRIPDGRSTVMNSVNISRWRNAAMDEALNRFRVEPGPAGRDTIAQLLGQEVPLLALMYGPTTAVHTWKLVNCPSSFFAQPFFCTMDLDP